MRTIQKQISLEPMTSRLPSVWPAYFNNEENLYYFDEDSLIEREWHYTSNWGMVPDNIVVNHNPNEVDDSDEEKRPKKWDTYSVVNGCHCYGDSLPYDELRFSGDCEPCISGECSFVLSFENLSKWYYFFNEYYNLLKQYGHCNRVYTSAEDYYNYESLTKYTDQMKYGSDKETYLNLDIEFANKGGKVEVLTFNKDTSVYSAMTPTQAHDECKNDRMAMVDVYDIGFFKWICDNVVPSFIIPMKYKDYWEKDRLFYPDVIKWLAWFKDKMIDHKSYETNGKFEEGKDGELDTWECKSQTIEDCCDCEEYFNRGGKRIYDEMKKWYDDVQQRILDVKSIVDGNKNCFIPTVILPTELQLSIDDLGEKSIFSTDYELGKDYRVAHYGDSANTYGGTVQTIDGVPMYFSGACQNNGLGFTFNPDYMEKYVSSCMTCGYEGVFAEICPKCGDRHIKQISYDPDRKENIEDAWTSYTERYITHEYCCDGECENCSEKYDNRGEFYVSAVTYFAYNDENVKYTSSASSESTAKEDLEAQMCKKYPLTLRKNGWILIDNELYPVNEIEYATYDKANKYLGNKKYMIFREKGTSTPYTFINGQQIYAEFYEPRNKFYFPFFKKPDASVDGRTFNFNDYIQFDRNTLGQKMYYINYSDNAYEVTGNTLTMNNAEYYRISGYSTDNASNMLYYTYDSEIRSGDTIDLVPSDVAVLSSSTEYFDNKPFIKVTCPFEVELYSADEINGRTVSKLADLRLYDVLTDDIGNDIDGIYPINTAEIMNYQPPEGTELEPLYQVGNTTNIARFSKTVDDLDNIEGNEPKNYFVGDIIKEMKFYYKEYDETIPEETIVDILLESGDTYSIKVKGKYIDTTVTSGYTSLSAITASTKAKVELEEDETETHVFYNDIFCDVTYYIGATLRRKNGENYNLCYEDQINNYGVEYVETVQFVKENREYYLRKPQNINNVIPSRVNDVSRHSISYPIYVYKMEQSLEHVYDSQYDSSYEVPMANFRFDINIFSGNGDTFSQKYSEDMAKHNDLQVFPTFREEYRFGVSVIENVDSDIYIDRGINAAFEKHLKLGEVTSLEALEQYGNGYFKIMES